MRKLATTCSIWIFCDRLVGGFFQVDILQGPLPNKASINFKAVILESKDWAWTKIWIAASAIGEKQNI